MTALVWFRRDLRVDDHPALRVALATHETVVPVFCLDDRLLHGRHASAPRTRFMLECLRDLDASLRSRGGRLVMRHGRPERELARLAGETGAGEIHFTADVTPFATRRERLLREALENTHTPVTLHAHAGLSVVDDVADLTTRTGGPFSVFSPFHRSWLDAPRREVLAPPRHVSLPAGLTLGRIPSAASLKLAGDALAEPAHGGEREGRRRWQEWQRGALAGYASGHDALGHEGTSRLSAHLRFGCLSVRALEAQLPATPAAQAFRRQLCWRDFYQHVLHHHPENARHEFQTRYRGTLRWNEDENAFRAWTRGRTGFPLVDAGMRQLLREGWMHNRARLVTGSFLTKDLGIDWRRGERFFMRWLLDGDEANNNGNWQWIASVGTDPAPVFRRMYNPARHQQRFDPEGRYVRRYVPELRGVPDRYLPEPWTMPPDVQRDCGCRIGRDYPAPIVERSAARAAALERYRRAAALGLP